MSVTPFTLALAGCLLVNWMLCVTYRTLHSCRNRVVLHIPFRTNEIMLAHSFLCSFSLYRIFSDFLKSNFSFVFLLSLSRSLLLIFFVFFLPLCISAHILLLPSSICFFSFHRLFFTLFVRTAQSVYPDSLCTFCSLCSMNTNSKKNLTFFVFHGIHVDYTEKSRCM